MSPLLGVRLLEPGRAVGFSAVQKCGIWLCVKYTMRFEME